MAAPENEREKREKRKKDNNNNNNNNNNYESQPGKRMKNPNPNEKPQMASGHCTSLGQCSDTHEFRMFGLFYLLERLNLQGHKVRAPINYDTLNEHASDEHNLSSLPTNWFGLCTWDTNEILTLSPDFETLVIRCIQEDPNNGYVIFPLFLWDKKVGHENYVLINCASKKMYRLEPNGYGDRFSTKYKALQLQGQLRELVDNINSNINYNLEFEVLEEKRGPHTKNPCGFCLTWAIWMVENFINSGCNYSAMMVTAENIPTPTDYNNAVYKWGTDRYNFLSAFLSHAQSRFFISTTTEIQHLQQSDPQASKRSNELIHLSKYVLYYRFCYILCLVERTYPGTLSSGGIDKPELQRQRGLLPKGIQKGGIKKLKQTKTKRKSKRKQNKKVSVKKHKKNKTKTFKKVSTS